MTESAAMRRISASEVVEVPICDFCLQFVLFSLVTVQANFVLFKPNSHDVVDTRAVVVYLLATLSFSLARKEKVKSRPARTTVSAGRGAYSSALHHLRVFRACRRPSTIELPRVDVKPSLC